MKSIHVLFPLALTVAFATGCPPVDPVDDDGGLPAADDAGPSEPEAATGSLGGGCYADGTCDDALFCDDGTCVSPNVGDEGGPCFPNGSCNAELSCGLDDICESVDNLGDEGGPCYANSTCNGDLVCNALNVCEEDLPQGVEDGPCRNDDTCNAGLVCEATRCIAAPAPIIDSFTAAPAFTVSGDPTILEWTSTYAEGCTISGEGPVAANGSLEVNPEVTTTYTLTCTNAAGSAQTLVTVNVSTPVQILSFAINNDATEITLDAGASATLIWSARFADGCSIDAIAEDIPTAGSTVVTPESTTVYTLTCTGEDGPVTAQVTINVNLPVAIESFTLDGSSDPVTADIGDNLSLAWTATDAVSCVLREVGEGVDIETDVNPSAGVTVVADTDRVFTLTCEGIQGPAAASVEMVVRPQVAIIDFSTTTPTITTGDSAFLAFEVENADACSLSNDLGEALPEILGDAGAVLVTPPSTTTYTLSCEGSGGPVFSSLQVVTLDPAVINSFTISGDPSTLRYLSNATFEWDVEDATQGCALSAPYQELTAAELGIGAVSAIFPVEGVPGEVVTFRLTCAGAGGDDSAFINIPVSQVLIPGSVVLCENTGLGCTPTHTIAELQEVTRIGGSLTVFSDDDLVLPRLFSVGGATTISVFGPITVSMPGLRQTDGAIELSFQTGGAPGSSGPSGVVDFERLREVAGDFDIDGLTTTFPSDVTFDVPQLESIDGSLSIQLLPCASDFSFPELVGVGANLDIGHFSGPSSPAAAFPVLDFVENDVDVGDHYYPDQGLLGWRSTFGVGGAFSAPSGSNGVCP